MHITNTYIDQTIPPPYAPPDTNVTFTTYHNVYVYSLSILWLVYGTAIVVTCLSVLVGIMAYTSNKGSYSTKFSTIFRITRDASLSVPILAEDTGGLDPLPEYLAKRSITFNGPERIHPSHKRSIQQSDRKDPVDSRTELSPSLVE